MNKLKNFSEFDDIYSKIRNSNDIDYLKELEKYVDADIENIGKNSSKIKEMKAKMRGMSVEELEKSQKEGFLDIKNRINKRIKDIENGN
jgi:ATP-dependent Clp protease ATP-binding subunit ClpA